MNNILRYEGLAKLAMVGLVTGGVLNTILDPILIFTFHLGIQGAGLSTAISQYISMFILFAMFAQKRSQSRIEWRYLNFSPKLMLNIIKNGFPSLISSPSII